MGEPTILSHYQIEPILSARQGGDTSTVTSLDLGLSTTEVRLEAERVVFSDREWLSWESIAEVAQNESTCFVVKDNRVQKCHSFSELLDRFYSLMPTQAAPTLLISGIPMHRIQGITPDRDTSIKIRSIAPLTGRVLDTCTGLGYTAIEAARTAEEVVTIELDPTVLEVARLNPWSRSLFGNPRIQQLVGDAFEEIQELEDASFSRVLHDPPMFSLAGELYSAECYRHLFRVLKHKGRLFHYIGDLDSRSGRGVARGVVRRLQEAGFTRVVRRPRAFGVVAYRS
jgi:predicted methyltransferase